MTENKADADGQINKPESQNGKKSRQTNDKKNQTDNVKWSIFTEAETKIAAGKAAKKAGQKLNEWIDKTLREAAIAELTTKPEPPARTEDLVKSIFEQFADKMQASQEANTKAQNAMIEEQGRQIAELTQSLSSQPKTVKEWIFGKQSNQDKK